MKRKAVICLYQLSILSEKQNLRVLCCNLFYSQNQNYSYFTVSEHLLCCFLQILWVFFVCLLPSHASLSYTILLLTKHSFNCVEEKWRICVSVTVTEATNQAQVLIDPPCLQTDNRRSITDVSSIGFFFFFSSMWLQIVCCYCVLTTQRNKDITSVYDFLVTILHQPKTMCYSD